MKYIHFISRKNIDVSYRKRDELVTRKYSYSYVPIATSVNKLMFCRSESQSKRIFKSLKIPAQREKVNGEEILKCIG